MLFFHLLDRLSELTGRDTPVDDGRSADRLALANASDMRGLKFCSRPATVAMEIYLGKNRMPVVLNGIPPRNPVLTSKSPELTGNPHDRCAAAIQTLMAVSLGPVQLKPESVAAFDAYVLAAESAMDETVHAPGAFLWSDGDEKRLEQVRKGDIVAEYWGGAKVKEPVSVPEGLIHDLIGAVFVPERSVQQTVALVQDYEEHKHIYKPEVADSKLMSRAGEDFQIYLRLLKKKIITVVLDTYHHAHYSWPGPTRALCRSHSTRILEVEHAGTPKEMRSQPDAGHGFLWRLYSYWRFEQKGGGVFIECRAISLTRDVPPAMAWVIKPIVRKLPKESLVHTLEATRKALAQRTERCSWR